MQRALAPVALFLVLFTALLPGPAWAGGGWHHGHRGGHGGWWWPRALIGGLAPGAIAIATAPLWALTPPPPPVVQAPPPGSLHPPADAAPPAAAAAPPYPV